MIAEAPQKPIDQENYPEWEEWNKSGGGGKADLENPVILENISDIPALKVQVHPFHVGNFLVEFPEVPRLLNEDPQSVQPIIKNVGSQFGGQFGALLLAAWDQADHKPISVSIVVSYWDTKDNKWETDHTLTYEYFRYQSTPQKRRLVKG